MGTHLLCGTEELGADFAAAFGVWAEGGEWRTGVFGDGGFVRGGGGEDYSAGDGSVADGREFAEADG